MRIIITCGPTITPLDEVRHISNKSTGRLGTLLANAAKTQGDEVICLRSTYCTYGAPEDLACLEFSTHQELLNRLRELASFQPDALWHVAAVGDYVLDAAWDPNNQPLNQSKWPSSTSYITLRLRSAPKIIAQLGKIFPKSILCGWKFEVDGNRESAWLSAQQQIRQNSTHACVVNGPAWGKGYGLVSKAETRECADYLELFAELRRFCAESQSNLA